MATGVIEQEQQVVASGEVLTANGYWRVIRYNRNYRSLWMAQAISLLGDWFDLIALTALVLRYNPSAQALVILLILRMLPGFLLAPLAGVLADRFNRRNLMLVADLGRAGVVLGFLLVNSADNLWLVYLFTLFQFGLGSLFEPSRSALLPSLTSPAERVTANSLSSLTWSVLLAVGAALGGLTAGLIGLEQAFIIDSLSFVLSAWFVSRIPAHLGRTEKKEDSKLRLGGDFKDGLIYLRQRSNILAYTMVKPLMFLAASIYLPVITLQARKVYPLGQDGSLSLGLLYLAVGVGSGLGPWLSSKLLRRVGENRANLQKLIGLYFILFGAGYLLFVYTDMLLLAVLFIILAELGSGSQWVFSTTLLQLSTTEAYRGRVFSIELALMTLSQTLALGLSTILIDNLQIPLTTIGLGIMIWQVFLGAFWLLGAALYNRKLVAERR